MTKRTNDTHAGPEMPARVADWIQQIKDMLLGRVEKNEISVQEYEARLDNIFVKTVQGEYMKGKWHPCDPKPFKWFDLFDINTQKHQPPPFEVYFRDEMCLRGSSHQEDKDD